MKPPRVRCRLCQGHGYLELSGVYADTLVLLRKQPGEVSGADLARIAGVTATSMSNRLVRLEQMGFATSRRYGCRRLFTCAKETK